MDGNVADLAKSLEKNGTAIAASNLVSAIVSASPSPMDVGEILTLYSKVYDHVATYRGPKREMTIDPSVAKNQPR